MFVCVSLLQLFNLPEELHQEDGSREVFMAVWHCMDKDDSDDISPEEFVAFCLQLHRPAGQKQKRKKTPVKRRNSAPYPSPARAQFSRSQSQAAKMNSSSSSLASCVSRGRSLSPAMSRSINRMHSDAEFYQEKKDRFKQELQRQEEAFLHETRCKWRNDMIRHRITGSPEHHPKRTQSAPRSSAKVGTDLYAKDMKWKEVRQKAIDELAATLQQKKAEEDQELTFKPQLITREFNDLNQISSVVGNDTRAAFLREYSEQRQQQMDKGTWPGQEGSGGVAWFQPKISQRSEKLARKRRMLRASLDLELDLSQLALNQSTEGSVQEGGGRGREEQREDRREGEGSRERSGSRGSARRRTKSPSVFETLHQVTTLADLTAGVLW
jgi:hypothetical protein